MDDLKRIVNELDPTLFGTGPIESELPPESHFRPIQEKNRGLEAMFEEIEKEVHGAFHHTGRTNVPEKDISDIRQRQRRVDTAKYEIVRKETEEEPNNLYFAYKKINCYIMYKLYGKRQCNFYVDRNWTIHHIVPCDKLLINFTVLRKEDATDQLLEACEDGWKCVSKKIRI